MTRARLVLVLLGLCVAEMAVMWIVTESRPPFAANDLRFEEGNAARGRLVFAAGDCASCHATPGQSDRLRLGGGLALASPFGTFRVPNISQDQTDGIGSWTTVDLANAMIGGVSPGHAHYYPVFPYPASRACIPTTSGT
jgi:mono/diheme cytochrome c family protein